jgi:hypothetical protein
MYIEPKSKILVVVKCTCIYFHFVHFIKFEMIKIQPLNQPLIQSNFDSKLLQFKLKINSQAINVVMLIIIFFGSYINANAHNMLIIMLDPHFKNMKII